MHTLQSILLEEIEFSNAAFGEHRPFTGPMNHLKREIDEVIAEKECDDFNGSLLEFADCQLLLLDAFRLRHPDLTADDLLRTCHNKIENNKRRKWGPQQADGVFEHIKE